jgi:hypothetical protein
MTFFAAPAIYRRSRVLLFALGAALLSSTNAFAAGEAHYVGASARLTGGLVLEKRGSEGTEETFAILRLRNPVSLLHRSQYPGDAPRTETGEILLRGGFPFADFAACDAVATGILDFRRVGWPDLPIVEMMVQRIECREDGRSSGTATPDLPSSNVRLDLYACESSPRSSVWFTRRWSPYSEMDEDMWKAADLLTRDDVVARWPFDHLRSLALRLFDARERLLSAFPDVRAEWEMEYVPRIVEVDFSADVQSRLYAVEVEDERIRRMREPVIPALEEVCEDVCGCTVILDRNQNGTVSLAFSPTTNLLYVVRRLRELPDVRSARLAREPSAAEPEGAFRKALRVRKLPSAFHFTFLSTALASGETTKRYFVVDEEVAQEVPANETLNLLSFDPPALPSTIWK